jgi:hypothetical protein
MSEPSRERISKEDPRMMEKSFPKRWEENQEPLCCDGNQGGGVSARSKYSTLRGCS